MSLLKTSKIIPAIIFLVFTNTCYADNTKELKSEKIEKSGKDLFFEKCGMCHREHGMGTNILSRRMDANSALLENRDNLAVTYVSFVVRNGFQTMYSISRAEVSNKQLAKIANYLSKEDK